MTSVKRRLVVSLTIVLVVLIGTFGAVLYLQAASSLGSQFDRNLLAKATAFAGTSEADRDGTLDFEFAEVDLPEFRPSPLAEYFQVWRWNGEVLARSRSLGETDLPRLPAGEGPRFQDLVLPDGRSGRAVVLVFVPQLEKEIEQTAQDRSGDTVLLVVARSREDLDGLLRNMLLGVLLAALVLPGIAGLLVHRVVVSGLRPLDRVAGLASSIGARQLDVRFPVEGLPAELRPICERLNGMIDRLRAAFDRERRFTADAAHELRTPIAELRSLAEVALRKAGDDESKESFKDALDIAVQMGRLTESLLALARCESGRQEIEKRELDLSALLKETAGSKVAIEIDVPPAVRVESDKALLTAILDNLFSNAEDHSAPGGKVGIDMRQEPGSVVLTLSNPCESLDQGDLEQLFEPFWRKDPARSDGQHAGIGLSLVKAYADLLDIEVKVGLPEPERIEVKLRIPSPKT
jgi:signal transduction histidine kinase